MLLPHSANIPGTEALVVGVVAGEMTVLDNACLGVVARDKVYFLVVTHLGGKVTVDYRAVSFYSLGSTTWRSYYEWRAPVVSCTDKQVSSGERLGC
jgi:hypothetical protein